MRTVICLLLWLMVVMLAARFIENHRSESPYEALMPESARNVLSQQAGLSIEVFAHPDSAAAHLVNNFLQPIMSAVDTATVSYVDIDQQPELRQSLGIEKLGELRIHQGDQSFHLNSLSYEAFFNGLKRLSMDDDAWVVFLDGLEGKALSGHQPLGYDQWIKALQSANYRVAILQWSEVLSLPDQVELIILPAPAEPAPQQLRVWLEQQAQQGRGLLWLTDPLLTSDQPELSLLFDVVQTDAFHEGHVILKSLPEHPVNEDFDRPLDLIGVMPYETSNQVLWRNDQQQAIASVSQLANSRQAVIGDSDFLANNYVFSGGNLEMSFRLVDWLLEQDDRIDLPSMGQWQSELYYEASEVLWFAALMLIVVPILLLLAGLFVWFRYNRGK